MFNGLDSRSPYDLHFSAFGIPVTIQPLFWLGSAAIMWVPGHPDEVVIGVMCVLVSILVHELGHALTTRFFGNHYSSITLIMFGGFATTQDHGPVRNIIVTFAGPIAGLLFFGAILLISILLEPVNIEHPLYKVAIRDLLWINLVWSIFNLFPIWPLDGGQIMRQLARKFMPRHGEQRAMLASVAFAVIIGVLMGQTGQTYGIMIVLYMGVMSYYEYQRLSYYSSRWR
jgi:Zn-dependent protease